MFPGRDVWKAEERNRLLGICLLQDNLLNSSRTNISPFWVKHFLMFSSLTKNCKVRSHPCNSAQLLLLPLSCKLLKLFFYLFFSNKISTTNVIKVKLKYYSETDLRYQILFLFTDFFFSISTIFNSLTLSLPWGHSFLNIMNIWRISSKKSSFSFK